MGRCPKPHYRAFKKEPPSEIRRFLFLYELLFSLHFCKLFLSFFVRVHVFAEDDEAIHAEFGNQVDHHGAKEHDVFVPACLRERLTPPRGERRKHEVVEEYLRHREWYILGGLEGKLPVDREVIHHRQRQRDEIARPIVPMDGFVEQRKRSRLNDPRRSREQQVFEPLQKILLLRKLCC